MSDETKAIIAGIVRHLIGAGGAYLAAHGVAVTDGQQQTIAGAVMVLIAIGWSGWHKTTVQPK